MKIFSVYAPFLAALFISVAGFVSAQSLSEVEKQRKLADIYQREIQLLETQQDRLVKQLQAAGADVPQLPSKSMAVPAIPEKDSEVEAVLEQLQAHSRQIKRENRKLKELLTQSTLDETIEEISRQVASIRGLRLKEPVNFSKLSADQLHDILMKALDEQIPPPQFAEYEFVLKIFGIIPRDLDLKELIVSFYAEQVGGLYDEESGKLYVVDQFSMDSEIAKIILAHEICHALQDQHYDLSDYPIKDTSNDDRALAAAAVVEGDASLLMMEWAILHSSWKLVLDVPKVLAMNSASLNNAPPALVDMFTFPYMGGMEFLQNAWPSRSSHYYEQAFQELPQSSEQILHPYKYYTEKDRPTKVTLPDLSPLLGKGWERTYGNVMGEYGTRTVVRQFAPGTELDAAAGWDGDRYEVYRREDGDAFLFAWVSVWDSKEDADEFAEAFDDAAMADQEMYTKLLRQDDKVALLISDSSKTLDKSFDTLRTYLKEIRRVE